MENLVILEDDSQLRTLARLIYLQEVQAVQNLPFNNESELAQYLRDSLSNYQSVLSLLDAGGELKREFQAEGDPRTPIAHDVFSYIVYSANSALQTVRNYKLRMNYLSKISEHAKGIMDELRGVDPENVTTVARMAEEAAQYRNDMMELTRMHQSSASRNFSRALKEEGLTFEELVQRYHAKLEYDRPFIDLEDGEKLEVYKAIIEASGRGRITVNQLSTALGVAGIAVLLFTTGMMVWDIFSSEHALQTATHDAVVTVASAVGGAILEAVVQAALSTDLIGVQASALFVVMAGVVSSIVGAFIIGPFAGWLIDLIIGSGGSAPLSTDGLICFVAPMPDGVVLARQIAHQQQPTN